MTAIRTIEFDDIRVGDTIRVVDVRDIKVAKAALGEEIRDAVGNSVLRDSRFPSATRKFQLVEREYENLPRSAGAIVSIYGLGKYILVNRAYAGSPRCWVSVSTGAFMTPNALQQLANEHNGFEVIA